MAVCWLQSDGDLLNQKRAMVLLKMALASLKLNSPRWTSFQLLHSVLDEFALPVIQVRGNLTPLSSSDGQLCAWPVIMTQLSSIVWHLPSMLMSTDLEIDKAI